MDDLNSGYRIAKEITRKYARSFYFASHFLKPEKRNAAFAIYAICRISDESVDNSKAIDNSERLNTIGCNIQTAYSSLELTNSLLLAFRQTINQYQIPREYFTELIKGLEMDLTKNRYSDFTELYQYCYKVAGIVGLMMLEIFGYTGSDTKECAFKLGIAMQLTNILRDIQEDFQRNRIYLPQDELKRFRVSDNDFALGRLNDNFKDLLKFQIERARLYYRESIQGIQRIKDSDSRLVAILMKNIYCQILNSIENNNYDVFRQRARVSHPQKILILTKTLFQSKYR
jgi:15-cis-phytoene synthase